MYNQKIIAPEKLKDVLITKTAIKTLNPESLVEKIISSQFREAMAKLKVYSEVEISGFGKFQISKNKLNKRINKVETALTNVNNLLENQDQAEDREQNLKRKSRESTIVLNYLKERAKKYED